MALDAEAELARSRIDPRYRANAETRGELANIFTLTGNAYELLSQALGANTAPDKDPAIVLSSSQQSRRQAEIVKSERRREQQRIQLTLADQARQLSERLGHEIAAMEAAFEAEMGDAWREQIANKVMKADEIPQRRDGESMKDYRERLETALIATIIDDDGSIRPEYANSDDPDVRRYADWAQAQHQKREVDAYLERRNDPSLSEGQRTLEDGAFIRSSSAGQMLEAQSELKDGAHLENGLDQQRSDRASSASAEADAFSI